MKPTFKEFCDKILTESPLNKYKFEDITYSRDAIEGDIFGQEGKIYNIFLTGVIKITDDSDYDRETGYGHLELVDYDHTEEFTIEENDADDNLLRNEIQIRTEDPELYDTIIQYAEEKAKEEHS